MGPAIDSLAPVNSLLLIAYGEEGASGASIGLGNCWTWLKANLEEPVLLSVCSLGVPDSEVGHAILKGDDAMAPLAVVQETAMTPRAAGLFFLKFFTELQLHSEDSITGKMVWFSAVKAKELLKRRKLEGRVGVKC